MSVGIDHYHLPNKSMSANKYQIQWLNTPTILIILYLIIPKVDILNIPQMKQGLRLQDLITMLLILLGLWAKLRVKIPRMALYILAFFSINFVFGLIQPGVYLYKIIFYLRYVEYLLLGISIYLLSRKINLWAIFFAFCFAQLLASIPQLGHVRISGTTAGPWELMTVGGIFLLYYINSPAITKNMRLLMQIVFLAIVIVCDSRVAMLYLVFVLVINYVKLNYFALFASIIILPIIYQFLSANERILSLFNYDNWLVLERFFDGLSGRGDYYYSDLITPTAGDLSLAVRLNIWFNLAILFWQGIFPFNLLFGVGFGSNGVVVDGFYTRLFFESGIIGIIVFVSIFLKIIKNRILIHPAFFLLVTGLTLDPYSSSLIIIAICLVVSDSRRFKYTKHLHKPSKKYLAGRLVTATIKSASQP